MLAFCLSLGVMFVADYFIGRVSTFESAWYQGLIKPPYSPHVIVYEIGYTLAFGTAVICCTLSTVKPNLRKTLAVWLGIALLSVLCPITLFLWHSTYGALGISAIIVAALGFLFHYYIKNTRELWLAVAPTIVWFAYLFVFYYGLSILN